MNINRSGLNQNIEQDLNILYLAELPNGQSPITPKDKWEVAHAPKEPIMKKAASSMFGFVSGLACTMLGTAGYPLYRDGICKYFCASKIEIMASLGDNIKFIRDNTNFKLLTSFAKLIENLSPQQIHSKLESLSLEELRNHNYNIELEKTYYNNPMIIGTALIAITILSAYCCMKCLTAAEELDIKAEELDIKNELKNSLKDRYEQIALRLKDLEDNKDKDVQEYARKILNNQFKINKEIENLKIPSLNHNKIKKITQPVIDAAKDIRLKNIN